MYSHIARVINEISLKCQLGTDGFIFLRTVVYQNMSICNIFTELIQDIFIFDEANGVHSLEYVAHVLYNLPSSLANDFLQNISCWEYFIRCIYYIDDPVPGSMMA